MGTKRATGPAAAELIPSRPTVPRLRLAALECKACDLWERATQTVFGEGPAPAQVMMVGEQPGDYEDRAGRPFVGPAGRLLDRALTQAGIDRSQVYVTNAVKHFKWEPKGQRRIHSKPDFAEIRACQPWLLAELAIVRPVVLVSLGATAAQSLMGRDFRVTRQRGQLIPLPQGPLLMATVHPSSILRAPDDDTRHENMELFVADLRRIPAVLAEEPLRPARPA